MNSSKKLSDYPILEVIENIEKGLVEENKLEFRRKPEKIMMQFIDGTKTRVTVNLEQTVSSLIDAYAELAEKPISEDHSLQQEIVIKKEKISRWLEPNVRVCDYGLTVNDLLKFRLRPRNIFILLPSGNEIELSVFFNQKVFELIDSVCKNNDLDPRKYCLAKEKTNRASEIVTSESEFKKKEDVKKKILFFYFFFLFFNFYFFLFIFFFYFFFIFFLFLSIFYRQVKFLLVGNL